DHGLALVAGADVDGVFANVQARQRLGVDLGDRLELDVRQLGIAGGRLAQELDAHQHFVGAVDLIDQFDFGRIVVGSCVLPNVLPLATVAGRDADAGAVVGSPGNERSL